MEIGMKKLTVIVGVALLLLPVMVVAQEKAVSDEEASVLERLQKAAGLIKTSNEAREAGIPEEDVAEVLAGAREQGLSPEETEEVLAESTAAVNESGPVDNFGAFVQTKLDEGLRGQELAAAIHEEHRHNGKGKGHEKHKGKQDKHKGHKHGQEGRHGDGDDDGDYDDDDDHDDDHDDDDDKHEGHGKGGKKEKGDK
jgi:hypothetical protein